MYSRKVFELTICIVFLRHACRFDSYRVPCIAIISGYRVFLFSFHSCSAWYWTSMAQPPTEVSPASEGVREIRKRLRRRKEEMGPLRQPHVPQRRHPEQKASYLTLAFWVAHCQLVRWAPAKQGCRYTCPDSSLVFPLTTSLWNSLQFKFMLFLCTSCTRWSEKDIFSILTYSSTPAV